MTTLELHADNSEATAAEHELATSLELLATAVRELDVDQAVAVGVATQKGSV